MKFKVTMKDPDVLHEAIDEAVSLNAEMLGLSNDETELIKEDRHEKVANMCTKNWFKYGECLTVEIDTEAKTCVVISNEQA